MGQRACLSRASTGAPAVGSVKQHGRSSSRTRCVISGVNGGFGWMERKLYGGDATFRSICATTVGRGPYAGDRREALLLLGDLSRVAARTVTAFIRATVGERDVSVGIVSSIQTHGSLANWHPHLHLLVTDGLPASGSCGAGAARVRPGGIGRGDPGRAVAHGGPSTAPTPPWGARASTLRTGAVASF